MKKIITSLALTLLILASSNLPALSYYFATDVETQVLSLDDKNVELVVTRHDDKNETEVFPVGTILKGKFFEYSFRKHFIRDEYIKVHLYQAKLPNGTLVPIDNDIKIRPRVIVNGAHSLQLAGAALGTALKITVAVWSVGFPTGRGIKAVTDAAFAVYNTPTEESKWKQGTKGFIKGALFPLPELVMKGEHLPIHDESYIWIQDAKKHKKNLTAFVVKRKNIYLEKDKYYDAKGKAAPDFTQYLRPKDMAKYQEQLAKKGVSAKIKHKEKIIEIKENVVEQHEVETEAVTPEEISEAMELKEEVEHAESARIQEQELTIKPHKHVWQRSWRKPKVKFEEAR